MTEQAIGVRKLCRVLIIATVLTVAFSSDLLQAQDANAASTNRSAGAVTDTNTLEIIKQLQRRVEELEQKVRQLEGSKAPAVQPADAKTQQQVEQLSQEVKALEQEKETEQAANAAKAKEAPKIRIGPEGFYFGSANGDFGVQLRGTLDVDSRTFFDGADSPDNDGLLLRRVRPILEGRAFQAFDFKLMPDFAPPGGPQILDAFLNYTYNPALQFKLGKFIVPVGLEMLQPDRDTLFNERALATDLVPVRDVGFALHGDVFEERVSYAAGIFNGTTDGNNSANVNFGDAQAYVGRLFFQPFRRAPASVLRGAGVGVSGSYETMSATNTANLPSTTGGHLPGYYSAGQQQFFAYNPADGAVVVADGNHWRLSPQAYYYYGPFGMFGEYVISDQGVSRSEVAPSTSAHMRNTAWEITGSWVLTGEDATYAGGVIPRRPFDPSRGTWGSLQLVGRYARLSIDGKAFPEFSDPSTSAGSAEGWWVGLNWYLNRNVRVNASFAHTHFDGGGAAGNSAPAAVTRHDEDVMFTRVQLAF